MIYLRSALFLIWFGVISVVIHIVALPLLLLPRREWTCAAARLWARLVLFGLNWLAGLGLEIRGAVPEGALIVASKHYTAWETIALMAVLRYPSMVMKESLLRLPVNGWFSRKMRMLAVDRSAGANAIRRMAAGAALVLAEGRPIVIFPEGTRKNIHDPPDYKPGVAALYGQLRVPCVPTAHNSGVFWVGGFLRRPGKIILEFLEPIPPGLPRQEFMRLLQQRIETAAGKLLATAEKQPAVLSTV
jgi:1-acyl-sn-glycerol-3-phosphate acyltransferase